MGRKTLNLSHALSTLGDLQDTIDALCHTNPDENAPLDEAIEHFVAKYGTAHFKSLDELLEASVATASYMPEQSESLDDLLQELLPSS